MCLGPPQTSTWVRKKKQHVPCVHSGLGELRQGTRNLAETALMPALCAPFPLPSMGPALRKEQESCPLTTCPFCLQLAALGERWGADGSQRGMATELLR